ncbi:MAG TPA: YkvA family protein [Burkholderiales bacterium]|nr:YkvA family protein [Burkholderiales bacterium]
MKIELYALYLAARHPKTPWYAKLIVAGFVAYALTPVDFVPDAIPIFGLVDDLIFIPLAVALAIRFVPSTVLAQCRMEARERVAALPKISWLTMVAVWAAVTAVGIAFYL